MEVHSLENNLREGPTKLKQVQDAAVNLVNHVVWDVKESNALVIFFAVVAMIVIVVFTIVMGIIFHQRRKKAMGYARVPVQDDRNPFRLDYD